MYVLCSKRAVEIIHTVLLVSTLFSSDFYHLLLVSTFFRCDFCHLLLVTIFLVVIKRLPFDRNITI